MQKKVIIALLVSIPILFGVFYLTVGGSSSIENDAEKLVAYIALKQDLAKEYGVNKANIKAIIEVGYRMTKIESKYKFEEREELNVLVWKMMMSLDANNLKNSFVTFYQTEKEDILKNHSK